MKKLNKKGFTLAELLIVVAIIAVLVAIAIPVFGAQLEKAKIATDKANVRSWYAEQVVEFLDKGNTSTYSQKATYDGVSLQAKSASVTISGNLVSDTYKVTYTNSSNDGLVIGE